MKSRHELLYWSSDPADVDELRGICRASLEQFGGLWGAGLYPLIGCTVLVTRAAEPARIIQVLALAEEVRAILADGTPHSRVLTVPPPEVLLPWHPDHQPAFARQARRPARRPSPTASGSGSTPKTAAMPARPTAVRTVARGGRTSLPASTGLF